MSDVTINGIYGAATVVPETAFETLQASLRGELLRVGQPGYEDARKIHNGMINKHPALIVRCAGAADVMSAVNFARDNDLLVSVRAGGHGVAGLAVCDGGLMIDLSQMKGIHVDPIRQTARADAGVTWGEFDHETQAFGLATTGGLVRPTGIAGLTLAGGHGFLMRKYGLACDNLLSVDVVTADGQLHTASATENPDLFWGVRGGGGNFGIVTSFEYQLHPVGLMLGGLLIYPMDQARQVLRFYHEFTSTAPDELGSLAVLGTLPNGIPAVIILIGYNGSVEQGEDVLRPLREFGTPLDDQIGPLPYTALQSIVENFNPAGLRNYWKMNYLKDLSDEAIAVMVERYATNPTPFTHLVLYTLGGAVSRVSEDETAVAYRDARHAFITIGMWHDSAEDEKIILWVSELWRAMHPLAADGFYVNYEADVVPDRVRAAYGAEKYARLVALKNQYDPANLFRLNQNIRPTM